jgi:hypothetical protein|tara:strand:- start:502 stop:1071 length:570 start_codon:yes stop_codon:yes gene_type:complete
MRLLLFVFTILFIFTRLAWTQDIPTQFDVITPPLCINNKGKIVQFQNLSSKSGMFSAGVAKRNEEGKPMVYRFNFEKSPKALQIFIDFHECAHHQTGDLEKPHPPQNSPEHMMKESIADCIAAIRIREKNKNGKTLIVNALFELKKTMSILNFPISSIKSRELNIKNCFKKKISSKIFIFNVLKKRGLK